MPATWRTVGVLQPPGTRPPSRIERSKARRIPRRRAFCSRPHQPPAGGRKAPAAVPGGWPGDGRVASVLPMGARWVETHRRGVDELGAGPATEGRGRARFGYPLGSGSRFIGTYIDQSRSASAS